MTFSLNKIKMLILTIILKMPQKIFFVNFTNSPCHILWETTTCFLDAERVLQFKDQPYVFSLKINFMFSHMLSQRVSRPECFLTEVTRDGQTLQMVRLNVVFHVFDPCFFSTDFTNISRLLSIIKVLLTLLHDGYHSLLEVFQTNQVNLRSHSCMFCICPFHWATIQNTPRDDSWSQHLGLRSFFCFGFIVLESHYGNDILQG